MNSFSLLYVLTILLIIFPFVLYFLKSFEEKISIVLILKNLTTFLIEYKSFVLRIIILILFLMRYLLNLVVWKFDIHVLKSFFILINLFLKIFF